MDKIYRYIDNTFKNLERTKETKRLCQQIQINSKEKYDFLISNGVDEHIAINKVISEIGTLEDYEEEYPMKNKTLDVLSYVFIFTTILSLVYSIYFLINEEYFNLYYIFPPILLFIYIVKPILFLCISFLSMYFINKMSVNVRKVKINRKGIRYSVLIVIIGILILYFFSISEILYFHHFSLPALLYFTTINISENSSLFFLFGILLYYGIKKS